MYKLEIAAFNLESVLIARQGGADRVELCESFAEGGITPSYGMAETARKLIGTDLFVMIRPRGGDFVYTGEEFQQMKNDILHFKKMSMNGFVFGLLDSNANVDLKRNKELVDLAAPSSCTFHRAMDKVTDPLKALDDVISCGFRTIFTSAKKTTAEDGLTELKALVKKAEGRIAIMPGGGVRSSNIEKIRQELNVEYYHSSAIVKNEVADLAEVKLLKSMLNP